MPEDELGVLLEDTTEDLQRLANVCRSRDLPLLVVLIPDQLQIDESLQRTLGLDPATADLDRPSRRLAEVVEGLGLPCLDLLPALRTGQDGPYYKPNDTHWNIAGNRLAAREIAVFVLRETAGREPSPAAP